MARAVGFLSELQVRVLVLKNGVKGSWIKLNNYVVRNNIYATPSECRECGVKALCRGGCYARAFNIYGKLPAPDPLCPLLHKAQLQA